MLAETFQNQVLNHISDAILVFSASGELIFANLQAQERFTIHGSQFGEIWNFQQLTQQLGIKKTRVEYSWSKLPAMPFTWDGFIKPNSYFQITFCKFNEQILVEIRDASGQRQREKMRSDAINMLVHDLRSPLTGIIGGLRLVSDLLPDKNEVIARSLYVADRSAHRILNLVESILDVAKLENPNHELNLTEESLSTLLQRVLEHFHPVIKEQKIRINLEMPDKLPMVQIDAELVERVLINLIDNAIKFSPVNGRVWVRASVTADREWVQVEVADEGSGVPPEDEATIFDRFRQGHSQAKSRKKGTGLGLTFSRLAIEAHGGKIWYEPQPVNGSIFRFTLPVAVF
jgi:signal transduction histidine kinase